LPDLGAQPWDLGCEYIDDELMVHTEIVVDQAIPHSSHRPPFDRGVRCTQLRRDALRGLTDDGEAPHDGALQGGVRVQNARCDAGAHREEIVALGEDMTKEFTRLE
jgi:hypothetical protein